ncbi:ATP-binding protein [Nocardiopsis sp. NPDC050513]|uniref:ATP-binding protein n=1 Tax=Nocardiopsis sp. NPDC050513 TaxID=3364338 RepID=UPI003791DA40
MRPTLTGRLFAANTLLLTAVLLGAGVLWTVHLDEVVEHGYEQRTLSLARTVAVAPGVAEALDGPAPEEVLVPLADSVRAASGARYVVFVDDDGIRRAHPDPDEIGRRPANDPGPILAGQTWTGVRRGPAGLTLRARVPVRDADGDVVGMVSVGYLAEEVGEASAEARRIALLTLSAALLLGAGVAYAISRRIRARTHGLEPEDITALLEGREALLHAIREGVVGLDEDRVVLANVPARRMLGLPDDCVGRALAELDLDEPLLRLLRGLDGGEDRFVAVGPRVLVCNRRPVRSPDGGDRAVVTLRDSTDLVRLSQQLSGARTVTRGLRAQRHEYGNRIHTVAGMLELGAVDEARDYLAELSGAHTRAGAEAAERVGDVALAALVLAKSAQASEIGARLELSPMTRVPRELDRRLRDDVLLVVGNLVDNALDAAGSGGRVELLVRLHSCEESGLADGLVEVRVADSGPGIPADRIDEVFTAGFSTKDPGAGPRGLGLSLVRQACARWGGRVEVETDEETVFAAYLRPHGPAAGAGAQERTDVSCPRP